MSAEIRELKKELEQKHELEKAIQDREYESVKVELQRTRARVATLETKVPPDITTESIAEPASEDPIHIIT